MFPQGDSSQKTEFRIKMRSLCIIDFKTDYTEGVSLGEFPTKLGRIKGFRIGNYLFTNVLSSFSQNISNPNKNGGVLGYEFSSGLTSILIMLITP
jgi:hypothetical protein